jgi:hypothetical protein
MLFTSPVFAQASGSIGGTVFSHNRGGMYTRNRSTPTNPRTVYQQAIRNWMATLASAWANTLDADERLAWAQYAANIPWTNKIGASTFLTGQQHFNRCNIVRLQIGAGVLVAAPTVFNLGTYTNPTVTAIEDDENITLAFTALDDWASAAGGHLVVYAGHPQTAGRAFYGGPYRYAGKVDGAVSPPSSPATIVCPFALEENQLVWLQCRVIQVDGRMSLPIVLGPTTVAGAA